MTLIILSFRLIVNLYKNLIIIKYFLAPVFTHFEIKFVFCSG